MFFAKKSFALRTVQILPYFAGTFDYLVFFFKKYVYTINHKRLALNYLVVSFISGLSGGSLATIIRWELSYSGSHFFKGDSLRYLQVITSHGLTMVFFVVVPIIFGFFANFFIPYHIGSKDVAFPRLNNLGFWLFPAGYVLIAKPAFLRPTVSKYYDKPSFFFQLVSTDISQPNHDLFLAESPAELKSKDAEFDIELISDVSLLADFPVSEDNEEVLSTQALLTMNSSSSSISPTKFLLDALSQAQFLNFLNYGSDLIKFRKKKILTVKCKNSLLTMSGWTFITPFSGNLRFTGAGAQDIAIITVLLSGLSTTISFTNLLITRRTLSMPGIRNRRVLIPFISITLFLVMRMLALITPVLGAAMIMLLMDRHWNTSFFDYAYGGDVILFHHLFWFFGHPEVYVVIIPAFGIMNSLLPFYVSRRIASKHHLIWATYIMGYMGFLVWGHHMYLVGLDHRSRSMYSTITVMISLPAIVKLVNWTLTVLNGSLTLRLPLFYLLIFFFFFLSGGLTGMWLSHVGLNLYVHDTFYVVAHFHFMFSSATFSAIFAGLYHYFHIIFGFKYSPLFGYMQLIYWFFGQWLTFLPLYFVGYNGLPRRYHDYPVIYMAWHTMSSVGHLLTIISFLFFFLMLSDSFLSKNSHQSTYFGVSRVSKRILFYKLKINFLKKSPHSFVFKGGNLLSLRESFYWDGN